MLHASQVRHAPGTYLPAFLQVTLLLAPPQGRDQLLGVKVGADRVLAKVGAPHKGRGLIHRVKVINLRLQHVPVRVLVVDAGRRPVIHAPHGIDAEGFALPVRQREVGQGAEREGDVLQAAAVGDLGRRAWDPDQGDSVVLFVVGDE